MAAPVPETRALSPVMHGYAVAMMMSTSFAGDEVAEVFRGGWGEGLDQRARFRPVDFVVPEAPKSDGRTTKVQLLARFITSYWPRSLTARNVRSLGQEEVRCGGIFCTAPHFFQDGAGPRNLLGRLKASKTTGTR